MDQERGTGKAETASGREGRLTGVFRYVRHEDVEARAASGWKFITELGEWSCLMWFCVGACREGEPP